jgi:hypothetical protein
MQTLFQSVVGIASIGFSCGLIVGGVAVLVIRRLRVAKRILPQFTTRFMYSGNLKQTNLLDAIQFLELGRREGILHIYVGRRKGYIAFVNGRIVDAFFRNTTGKESIFMMLELEYGDFYFESKTLNQPPVITESIMDIALEWDARKYTAQDNQGSSLDNGDTLESAVNKLSSAEGTPRSSNGVMPESRGDTTQQGKIPGTSSPRQEGKWDK